MPAQLRVTAGPDKDRVFPLSAGVTLVIGRGQASHTRLVDPQVSRAHCEIRWEGGQPQLADCQSVGGTFVNGQKVSSQALRSGDLVQIGETQLRFEVDVAADQTLPPPGAKPAVAAPAPVAYAPGSPAAPVKPATAPAPAAYAPGSPAAGPVFARKIGGKNLPRPLQELHELAGKTFGNYELLSAVGTGLVGVVFRARDTRDQKIVALKVLRSDLARDDKAVQRFVRGMQTAIAFNHPHLVKLLGAGMIKPHCWIAMEFVEGESLADICNAPARQVPLKTACQIAKDLARALAYIHDQGVIHRNVMPQNILIRASDQSAKLGDVMLAKSMDDDEAPAITGSNEMVGNVYYMSPERTAGVAGLDGRADIYSLGVTLYQLVTKQLPFTGGTLIDVIGKIRKGTAESPARLNPALPPAFAAAIVKMLAKRPEDRFQSAAQLSAELEAIK